MYTKTVQQLKTQPDHDRHYDNPIQTWINKNNELQKNQDW